MVDMVQRVIRPLNILPQSLALLGLVIIMLAGFSLLLSRGGQASLTPVDAEPQSRTATDRQVERLQERLGIYESDHDALVGLGAAYLQKAREVGDASYYSRAEDALLAALEQKPDSSVALMLMGTLALARHQFGEALEWAERLLEINPMLVSAYGVLGDAQVELGHYDDAIESLQTMVDLKPNLDSYARVSYIRELTGDVEGAIEAMQMAVDAGPPKTETSAWARVQLGNLYFNSGRVDEAEIHYEAALREFSGYYLALAALGNVRAARGRYDEAIRLYEQIADIIPQPAILATLGDLYSWSGQKDKAQAQYDTVEFIAKLAAVNGVVYNREMAVFYADHDIKPDQALALARTELAVRQDIYGYDTLAWALYRNGYLDEAADAIARAMRLGTQDAKLYYHAGMIHFGLGNREQAASYLAQALTLNPHFSILQVDEASRTLSNLRGEVAR